MIAGLDLPATSMSLDQDGRGGRLRADKQKRPAGGQNAIHFARHHGSTAIVALRDQADIAQRKPFGKLIARNIRPQLAGLNVVGGAEVDELLPPAAAAYKQEAKTRVFLQHIHCAGQGIQVMRKPEIAGVKQHKLRGISWTRQRQ